MFGLVSLLEDVSMLLSGTIYSYFLYPATLEFYAGFSFLLSAALLLIPLAMAM